MAAEETVRMKPAPAPLREERIAEIREAVSSDPFQRLSDGVYIIGHNLDAGDSPETWRAHDRKIVADLAIKAIPILLADRDVLKQELKLISDANIRMQFRFDGESESLRQRAEAAEQKLTELIEKLIRGVKCL